MDSYQAGLSIDFIKKFDHFSTCVAIVIGKLLKLSPAFPPLHTVQAIFPAYGVPTNLDQRMRCFLYSQSFCQGA
jgi:hypothetical protein